MRLLDRSCHKFHEKERTQCTSFDSEPQNPDKPYLTSSTAIRCVIEFSNRGPFVFEFRSHNVLRTNVFTCQYYDSRKDDDQNKCNSCKRCITNVNWLRLRIFIFWQIKPKFWIFVQFSEPQQQRYLSGPRATHRSAIYRGSASDH